MTIALRCSSCGRTLTWISGSPRCANPVCGGHVPTAQGVEEGQLRRRSAEFERSTLELVSAAAPVPVGEPSPFVIQASARLELGERAYGDRWARQAVPVLLAELLEEAADLGGWAMLTLQSLGGLSSEERETIESCVLDAARAGARAHSAIVRALASVPPAGRERGET